MPNDGRSHHRAAGAQRSPASGAKRSLPAGCPRWRYRCSGIVGAVCPAPRVVARVGAAAASVSATRTSSGSVSAIEAIQVLGKIRMSVFYLFLGALVRKIQNTQPTADRVPVMSAAGAPLPCLSKPFLSLLFYRPYREDPIKIGVSSFRQSRLNQLVVGSIPTRPTN